MKLFLSPGSCSLSPHIVLEESGLPYTTQNVNLRSKEMAGGGDFTAVNPKGYVPALVLDDGQLLTEGSAIVQYIADQVPEKKLAPPNGTLPRYQLQSWLNYISTEIHKSFTPFFRPNATDDWKALAMANLEKRLTHINEHLAQHAYLLGETFSVADAYLFTVLNWSRQAKLDLGRWPNVTAFHARVGARPAVQAAMKAEGLI